MVPLWLRCTLRLHHTLGLHSLWLHPRLLEALRSLHSLSPELPLLLEVLWLHSLLLITLCLVMLLHSWLLITLRPLLTALSLVTRLLNALSLTTARIHILLT